MTNEQTMRDAFEAWYRRTYDLPGTVGFEWGAPTIVNMFQAWKASPTRRIDAMRAIPEEWQLVPSVPTDEMQSAAQDNWMPGLPSYEAGAVWSAMLAAAPTPPIASQEVEVTDKERLDHLQVMADNGCVSMCFEVGGGFHVTLDGIGGEPEAARNVESIRAGIDYHIGLRDAALAGEKP